MLLYLITFKRSDCLYFGITNDIKKRASAHNWSARSGVKRPLYDCIRKYRSFDIDTIAEFSTREEAGRAERYLISLGREEGRRLLNLADGGEGGFAVRDVESWKKKLSEARVGRKPALGMTHSEENRELFSRVSKEYWETQETYNPTEVLSMGFSKARDAFGISKTHYYRLRKRAQVNDLC